VALRILNVYSFSALRAEKPHTEIDRYRAAADKKIALPNSTTQLRRFKKNNISTTHLGLRLGAICATVELSFREVN
jgi:hypothetical protein